MARRMAAHGGAGVRPGQCRHALPCGAPAAPTPTLRPGLPSGPRSGSDEAREGTSGGSRAAGGKPQCGCEAVPVPTRPAAPHVHLARPPPVHAYTQVKHNEPGTLSYELCVGDADPLKVLVYER